MSLSYGYCEANLGATGNAYYSALWQQGDAQGMSIMVSTGDSGSDGCDDGAEYATSGVGVSGFASTPYNTAVGGTDFLGTLVSPSTFWSATNNSTTQASALGYIPESTWDNNCTNPIYQTSLYGTTYNNYANAAAACKADGANATLLGYGLLETVGGSGGESTYSAKPSWQVGTGVPANANRNIPDVSFLAANGSVLAFANSGSGAYYGSFYIECEEDATGGGSCNLNSPYSSFVGIGGTSVSTPAFAGIVAMINQKTASKQGLVNYVLYDLYQQQITAGTSCTSSYATTGTGPYVLGAPVLPAVGCVFNDVTWGANSAGCSKGSTNCVTASGNYGILTTAATATPASTEAYVNTVGYDLATGLGSVNAANLVNGWSNVTFAPTNTALALSSTTFAHGTSINATVMVTPQSGSSVTPTGLIQLDTNTTPIALGPATLASGTVTQAYTDFPGGTYNVSAYYAGDGTYAASTSTPVFVTVTPENSTIATTLYTENLSTGALTSATTMTYGGEFYLAETVAGVSGKGTPTGTLNILNGGSSFGSFNLNSGGTAGYNSTITPAGNYSYTAKYSGDSSFNSSTTTAAKAFTINKSASVGALTRSGTSIAAGAADTLTDAIVGNNAATIGNYGVAPTGTVTYYSGLTSGAQTTLLGTATLSSVTSAVNATTGLTTYTSSAKLTTSNLPYSAASQKDYITMVYSGDSNYGTTTTAGTYVTVAAGTKTASTTTVTASPNTVIYGNTTVLTATVSTTSTTAYPTNTDTVSFYVDGTIVGTAVALSGGAVGVPATASISVPASSLLGGTRAITASFSGDTNLLGSSGLLSFNVSVASTAVTLTTSSSSPVLQGTGVVYNSTVPYTAPVAPTGSITYSVDGTAVTTVSVLGIYTGGVGASFSTNTLSAGSHIITASYSGDKNYASSVATSAITVTSSNSQMSLTLSSTQSSTIVLGAPFTINVLAQTLNAGPTPTGTISYSVDGGTVTSGVALTSGATSFILSGLSILRHVVTVVYSGDMNYATTTQSLVFNGGIAQIILFPNLPNTTKAVAPTVSLAARATSGLPVTYTVSGPASLAGSILTITGTGSISVTASQAGNASFNAATSVVNTFTAQ